MKQFNYSFDKILEPRARLGIMSILVVNDWVDFNTLKELLGLTDGNLASHLSTLEKNRYILLKKEFAGRKPRTIYRASAIGKKAFASHIDALEKFIKSQN